MFLVSLHCTGGSARGAMPLANGPRHCGQYRRASVSDGLPALPTLSAEITNARSAMSMARWRNCLSMLRDSLTIAAHNVKAPADGPGNPVDSTIIADDLIGLSCPLNFVRFNPSGNFPS